MAPWLVLAAAVVIALLAEFVLDAWVELSPLLHWIQHGVIFWSGLAAGAALAAVYRTGQVASP